MGEHQRKECVYNKRVLTCVGSQRFSCIGLPLLHISEFPLYPLFSSFMNTVPHSIQYGIFTMGCKESHRIVNKEFRVLEKEVNICV
jgi:hypothetical protein